MTFPSQPIRVAAWAVLAAIGCLGITIGWDRGPDPLIDFGRELYVPWRLVEGDVLHRDIAWFNGPLGPWLIEGWMRVFGVSLDALQALNALVIAAVTVLLALILRRLAGEAGAWIGGFVFLTVFAVAQQETIGNYLFLAPYSHGITFGFAAGLGSLWALSGAAGAEPRRRALWLTLAGLFAGLAFLSKAEIFLGTAIGAGAALVALLVGLGGAKERAAAAALFTLGFALPLVAAGARFAGQIGLDETPLALLGTWPYAFNDEISSMPFYRKMRGTDDLGASLRRMGITAAGTAAFLAAVLAVAGQIGARSKKPLGAAAAAFGISLMLTGLAFVKVRIAWMLLPLTILLPLLAAGAFVRWRRALGDGEVEGDFAASHIAAVGFSFFAAGLLPKVLFAPLARQYGFVLSVPGCLLAAALIVVWVPDWLERRRQNKAPGNSRSVLWAQRSAAAATVLAFAVMNVNATRNQFTKKTVELGEGSDRIWSGPWRGTKMRAAYVDLRERLRPGDELLVLPEGITLNYLLRAKTPTRLVNFMAPELAMFDEAEIVATLEARPPAAVALVHRPTDDYGFPFFGQGYGESILGWVQEHYRVDLQIGEAPFIPKAESKERFGVSILIPK